MKSSFKVEFPGRPVPWSRVKRGRNGHAYTPTKQRVHRRQLALVIKQSAKGVDFMGQPVLVDMSFDYSGEGKTTVRMYPGNGDYYRGKRPDVDNLIKQVLEAIEDSGIVGDDAIIASVRAEKVNGER